MSGAKHFEVSQNQIPAKSPRLQQRVQPTRLNKARWAVPNNTKSALHAWVVNAVTKLDLISEETLNVFFQETCQLERWRQVRLNQGNHFIFTFFCFFSPRWLRRLRQNIESSHSTNMDRSHEKGCLMRGNWMKSRDTSLLVGSLFWWKCVKYNKNQYWPATWEHGTGKCFWSKNQ